MADGTLAVQGASNPTANIDNEAVTTGAGAVLRQRVRIGGGWGTLLQQVSGYGSMRVTPDNCSQFYDPFDTPIDVLNQWNPAAVAGSGAASQATGGLTLTTGSSASSYATLGSMPTFVGLVPAFCQVGWANKLPAAPPAGTYAFWGVGTVPATPTPAAPLTDAVGWEIDTAGKLWAVVYQNGVRTTINALDSTGLATAGDGSLSSSGSAKQPTDGNYHRYSLIMRTDRTFWYFDGQDAHVAASSFQFPAVQKLPLRMLVISGSSAPPAPMTLTSTGVGVGDSGANAHQLADGTFPWRKATVTSTGGLLVAGRRETSTGVAVTPPSSTGTITAASGLGGTGAAGLADTSFPGGAPAAGSTVVVIPQGDHSSFSVQVTGTWVGTLATEVTMDGVTWVAVNTRASGSGSLKNNFSVNGLYRGVVGGMFAMRVRAIAWTSGTANVWISLGVGAAVFQNSDVLAQTEAQYYASSAGGNAAWGVCSQEVTMAQAGTEYPIMWMFNTDPVGGRVLYFAKTVKGSNGGARFHRWRTGPGGTQMSRTSGGTLIAPTNRANQNATATAAQVYAGTNLVITNQPSAFEKTVFLPTTGGQIETDEQGSILLPPQTGLYWTCVCGTANTLAMIELVYWEGTLS